MHWKLISNAPRPEKPQKRTRRPRGKPTVELLEDRRLLSVTSSLFVVNQAASALTLSGDIGGFPLQQQANGSLTSSYSGSIVADWDLDGLTINLDQPGTSLAALVTGDWQPKPDGSSGSAPADYGGKVTILFVTAQVALRGLTVAASTANPLPLSGTGPYSFTATQTLTVLWGTADYNAGLFGSGSKDLSSLSAQNAAPDAGTFEDQGGGSYRLSIPVSLTIQQPIENLTATLHINGQIVATAVLPVVNLNDGITSSFNYFTSAVGSAGPVAIEDPAAAVLYTPPGNLTSMTVTLINHPDNTAEFLGYDLGNSGLITNGYDPASGQLVITGSADPSVYQAVLRTITYENDSPTPDPSNRLIQFVVSDGTNTSLVRTATVSISAPAGPSAAGPFAPEKGLQSLSIVSDSFLHTVIRTPTVPITNGLTRDVKAMALDLATTLITIPRSPVARSNGAVFRVPGGEIRAPFDKFLALEAWAIDLAMDAGNPQ
jgi:hypothetical protein